MWNESNRERDFFEQEKNCLSLSDWKNKILLGTISQVWINIPWNSGKRARLHLKINPSNQQLPPMNWFLFVCRKMNMSSLCTKVLFECVSSLQYTSTLPINYLSSCKVGKHVGAQHLFVVTNSEGVKSSVGPCLRYCVDCKIQKILWFTTAHVWETV